MNTYSVTTGVLIFDGEPIITEGLKAWLRPVQPSGVEAISAEDTYLGLPGVGIYEEDENYIPIDDLDEAIGLALRARGIEYDATSHPADLLEQLIDASGLGEQAQWLTQILGEDETFDASDLVRCALLFGDGHNARAAMLQTGVFSDGTSLWSHGGYTEVIQRLGDGSVSYALLSPRELAFAAMRGAAQLADRMGKLAASLVPPEERGTFLGELTAKVDCGPPQDLEAADQRTSRDVSRPTN